MVKPVRVYWDSCAWLGLLNGEVDKKRELEIVYGHSKLARYELWTSTLSVVEVRRVQGEILKDRPWSDANTKTLEALFRQPFIKMIPLAVDVAESARRIFRENADMGKWQDAVQLASALRWDAAVMHTYDYDDLIRFDMKFTCRSGGKLPICYPDESTDGPLFSQAPRP